MTFCQKKWQQLKSARTLQNVIIMCNYYKPVIEWFKQLLSKCCNINSSMIRILMFDIQGVNSYFNIKIYKR